MAIRFSRCRLILLGSFGLWASGSVAYAQAPTAIVPPPLAENELPFSLIGPTARLPERTALKYRNTSLDAPAGRVVLIGGYITVAAVGASTSLPNPLSVYSIKLKTADTAFYPFFSPDGKSLLFFYGWPYDEPYGANVYLLDLTTNKVRRGPLQAGQKLSWSPNSRFIACPVGDVLYIYDVKSDKSRRVMRDEGVSNLAWTSANTLLFTRRTPLRATKPQTPAVPRAARPILPAIYEVPIGGRGWTQLVVEGGAAPCPSPDGRWLAYFGSPTTPPPVDEVAPDEATQLLQQVQKEADERGRVCLYDRVEKKRVSVATDMKDATLKWTPDGKKLVLMKTSYNGITGEGEAQVFLFDLDSMKLNPFTTLHSKDDVAIARNDDHPPIQLLQVSNDGKNLIISEENFLPPEPKTHTQRGNRYIRAVSLLNGSVITLAQIYADLGTDWHDESVSAIAAKPSRQP